MPGALHGYLSDEKNYESRGNATLCNIEAPAHFSGKRCLAWDFKCSKGTCSRIQTPVSAPDNSKIYHVVGTPRLYPGMNLKIKGFCESGQGDLTLRLSSLNPAVPDTVSAPFALKAGQDFEIHWKINSDPANALGMLSLQIHSLQRESGRVLIDYVDYDGDVDLAWKNDLFCNGARNIAGWISNLDQVRHAFSDDNLP